MRVSFVSTPGSAHPSPGCCPPPSSDRGADATGLVFVGPLGPLFAPAAVVAGAVVALLATGVAGPAHAARVARTG